MKPAQPFALTIAALTLVGAAPAPAAAFAGNDVAAQTDPNFVPDSGTINRGFDAPVPSTAHVPPVPSAADIRAALKMPDSDQPSLGAAGGAATGGPIAATGQTMPAKFSRRNDILDRVPTMALTPSISDEDRARIYRAVMADKTPPATHADRLAPASELDAATALHDVHPLPASVRGIAGVRSLAYVKSKDKVFLVRPDTRVVLAEITS